MITIYLEIRNPKKASNRYEIGIEGLLPDKPVIQKEEEWITENHRDDNLGLGLALRGEGGTVGERRQLWWHCCDDVGARGCLGGAAGGVGIEHDGARAWCGQATTRVMDAAVQHDGSWVQGGVAMRPCWRGGAGAGAVLACRRCIAKARVREQRGKRWCGARRG